MVRPKRIFATKAEREKHEAHLVKRRAKSHEHRTVKMATKAAEGQSDFASLVEAEKARMGKSAHHTKAGASSPKLVTQARENLTAAFDLMGGVPALVVWGRENPTEFYRIWARLIPKETYEPTSALPLESLLEKLASREEMTVLEAATEIGEEVLAAAAAQVAYEDSLPGPEDTVN